MQQWKCSFSSQTILTFVHLNVFKMLPVFWL